MITLYQEPGHTEAKNHLRQAARAVQHRPLSAVYGLPCIPADPSASTERYWSARSALSSTYSRPIQTSAFRLNQYARSALGTVR